MEKIKYYYSTMSKQVFLILLILFIVLRFMLMMQVVANDINGYAEKINLGATLMLYAIYFGICIFFLTAYKGFYVTFDEHSLTYHNRLLRTNRTIVFDGITRAHLGKRGIRLYRDGQEKADFYLPFFRFGVISLGGMDRFYKMLKNKPIAIQKDFLALPGHGKGRKWISLLYTCLALLALASVTQTLALIVAILKQG